MWLLYLKFIWSPCGTSITTNVECKLLKPYHRFQLNADKQAGTAFYVPYIKTKTGRSPKTDDERATITVPIMYTRFVAPNYASLGKDYKQYFAI